MILYLNDLLKLNSNVHFRQTKYSNAISVSQKCDRQAEGGRSNFYQHDMKRVEQFTSVFKTKNLLNF